MSHQQILQTDGEARFQALLALKAAKALLTVHGGPVAYAAAQDHLRLELLAFEQKFGSLKVAQ